ncbi:putative TetR family transcriptional regulator [Nocardia brasiliensis NBRC 14402]|uniref:TetR/AcrR family transcriptional regulator n=1 Tax=Nocardia brasiliensis TaxID=37326 RepID=UPI0002DCA7D1|nr:TetR/AcrR family transcriptional regulator [Nocardia brasiliensis]ASF08182.1 TetR/AcrR family transcriptional regulator [Nocardia brasiliensis]GAJ83823.1 putative TetR family transcriptional regulator [Nocardia brasiliensis NBRC 14402]SUB54144.1 Bacterial regulatory proteins, tetR family [Nocardia brasiliensis]
MGEEAGGRVYRGRSADERASERRRRMLDAAVELFGERGYPGTSIGELCTAARVSYRSFYEEFGALDQLLIAAVDEFDARAAERVAAALVETDEADFATRAAVTFRAFLAATCPNRRAARMCFVEIVRVADTVEIWRRERRRRFARLFVSQAEIAAERGEIASRPFAFAAIATMGAVIYAIQEWVNAEPVFAEFVGAGTDELADQLARIYLDAVGPLLP